MERQESVRAALSSERVVADCGTPDGRTRSVSELDLARYDKGDLTGVMARNVMKRCFAAFDVESHGRIDAERMQSLIEYLHRGAADVQSLLAKCPNGCTFDDFFGWWESLADKGTKAEEFALVNAHFADNIHVQQLLVSESGDKFSLNYRVTFQLRNMETGVVVPASPWHDIPLFVRSLVKTTGPSQAHPPVNFITEIPKWTRAKFEISRTEPFNPIKQDTKQGVPRFYKHGDMCFNYGAFPQTWESTYIPVVLPDGTKLKGDNDPLDAIEIGVSQLPTGSVTPVKLLAVLGMIDNGEMDWKLIIIATDDPLARYMDDVEDVRRVMPGCLEAIREWMRVYKICQGGEENVFAFDGEFKNAAYAHKVLRESHNMWQNLHKIRGQVNTLT